jgi:biopolymer transport protein ExbB
MLYVLEKGGPILILIILLSVAAAVIIIERLIYFRKMKGDEDKLINRLKETLKKGHYDEALSICESNPSPVANLIQVGLENRDQPPNTIKEIILDTASLEIPRMERYLSALGTIANIAPLLGLLGTVTGNIRAFSVLSNMKNIGDPSILAPGIAEALFTTVAGIIVSVPALAFYNYFASKVNHTIIRMETKVNELINLLGLKQDNRDKRIV